MITRFDRFLILFRDMENNIMRLNGEFELQLTIEDMYDQMPSSILPMNQFSMIEVFGNTRKEEGCEAGQSSLIRSMFHLVSVALYRFRVVQCAYRSSDSDQYWQHITGSVNTPRCLGYRNNHRDVECELCLLCSNW